MTDSRGVLMQVDLKATLFKAEEDAKRAKAMGTAVPKSKVILLRRFMQRRPGVLSKDDLHPLCAARREAGSVAEQGRGGA